MRLRLRLRLSGPTTCQVRPEAPGLVFVPDVRELLFAPGTVPVLSSSTTTSSLAAARWSEIAVGFADRKATLVELEQLGTAMFDAVIGRWWVTLVAAVAGGERELEIALEFEAGAESLANLPWELLREPGGFLARGITTAAATGAPAFARVAITRLLPRAGAVVLRDIELPPRVLFVVSQGLDDVDLRPGALIMGILRHAQTRIEERILVRPSIDKVADEVRAFEPDVVHLVCHGLFDAKRGSFLRFADRVDDSRDEDVPAADIASALIPAVGKPPVVVVLSACSTANATETEHACNGSLAATLVNRGIALAVAMTGRVEDQPQRLFVRRFAEVLVDQVPPGSLVWASAEGRSRAMNRQEFAPTNADWARFSIWMGADVPADLRPREPAPTSRRAREQKWALDLLGIDPMVRQMPLLERESIRSKFREFLASKSGPVFTISGSRERSFQQGGIVEEAPQLQKPGITRALLDLGLMALRAGQLPCLVPPASTPRKPRALVQAIVLSAIQAHRKLFGTSTPLPDRTAIDAALNAPQPANAEIFMALSDFLVALRTRAVAAFSLTDNARLIVIIDDLDVYFDDVGWFIECATPRAIPDNVAFLIGYNANDIQAPRIRAAFASVPGEALTRFGPGVEDLVYQTILLNPFRESPVEATQRWLIVNTELARDLSEYTYGCFGAIDTSVFYKLVRMVRDKLRIADDDEILRAP